MISTATMSTAMAPPTPTPVRPMTPTTPPMSQRAPMATVSTAAASDSPTTPSAGAQYTEWTLPAPSFVAASAHAHGGVPPVAGYAAHMVRKSRAVYTAMATSDAPVLDGIKNLRDVAIELLTAVSVSPDAPQLDANRMRDLAMKMKTGLDALALDAALVNATSRFSVRSVNDEVAKAAHWMTESEARTAFLVQRLGVREREVALLRHELAQMQHNASATDASIDDATATEGADKKEQVDDAEKNVEVAVNLKETDASSMATDQDHNTESDEENALFKDESSHPEDTDDEDEDDAAPVLDYKRRCGVLCALLEGQRNTHARALGQAMQRAMALETLLTQARATIQEAAKATTSDDTKDNADKDADDVKKTEASALSEVVVDHHTDNDEGEHMPVQEPEEEPQEEAEEEPQEAQAPTCPVEAASAAATAVASNDDTTTQSPSSTSEDMASQRAHEEPKEEAQVSQDETRPVEEAIAVATAATPSEVAVSESLVPASTRVLAPSRIVPPKIQVPRSLTRHGVNSNGNGTGASSRNSTGSTRVSGVASGRYLLEPGWAMPSQRRAQRTATAVSTSASQKKASGRKSTVRPTTTLVAAGSKKAKANGSVVTVTKTKTKAQTQTQTQTRRPWL